MNKSIAAILLAFSLITGCTPAPKPSLVDHAALVRRLETENEKLRDEGINRERKLYYYRIGMLGAGATILALVLGMRSRAPERNAEKEGLERRADLEPEPHVKADWAPSSNGSSKSESLKKCTSDLNSGNEGKKRDSKWEIVIDGNGVAIRNGSFRAERLLSLIVALQSRKLDYGIVFDHTARQRATAVGPCELQLFELLRRGTAGPCIISPGGVLHLHGLKEGAQVVSNDLDLPRLFAFRRSDLAQHIRFHRIFFSSRSFRTTLMRNEPLPLIGVDEAIRRLSARSKNSIQQRPSKHAATAA